MKENLFNYYHQKYPNWFLNVEVVCFTSEKDTAAAKTQLKNRSF